MRLPSADFDPKRPALLLPDTVESVILCADADNGDPHAAECLLQRAAPRIARPPEGQDFNNVLRRGAPFQTDGAAA